MQFKRNKKAVQKTSRESSTKNYGAKHNFKRDSSSNANNDKVLCKKVELIGNQFFDKDTPRQRLSGKIDELENMPPNLVSQGLVLRESLVEEHSEVTVSAVIEHPK